MLENVPKHSCFFRNSLMVHMSCKKRQIENMLAEAYARRQTGSDSNHYFQMDVRKTSMVKFEDKIECEIDKHKTLMHKMCFMVKNEKKRDVFEREIMLLQLYEEILLAVKFQYNSKRKWNMIHGNLATTSCHEKNFVAYLNKSITPDMYMDEMNSLKRELEGQTKVVNHQVWANACFSHFLFLRAIDDKSPLGNFFRGEALKIYKFHNNPRHKLIETCLINQETLANTLFPVPNPVIEMHCTIQWIIRNAPNVKQFIRLGISSAEKSDIWILHFDWQALN
jgi:hypothetical protein